MGTLTCEVCGRGGFKRLTRHLSQVHGMSKAEYREKFPSAVFEVVAPRRVSCVSCKKPIEGYSGRASNVKCMSCRKTPLKHRKGNSEADLVACRICGLQRRRLGAHIKSAHEMSVADYREQFPDALVDVPGSRKRSEATRAKQAAAARRRWADPEERAAQSERLKNSAPWKGKKLSAEHKQAISEGGLGVPHDLSDEGRTSLQAHGRRAVAKLRKQPGYGARLAAAQIRRAKADPDFGFRNKARWKKGFETRKRNGTLAPPGSGRGINGFRKGIKHHCRSTLEANFARVLIEAGISYEYESKLFKLASGKHYLPDFKLHDPLVLPDGSRVPAGWVELKGWRHKDGSLPGDTGEKIAELGARGIEVFALASSDALWKAIRDHYRPLIPLWETQRRNLRTHPDVFGV